ncbi:MAG: hybrid sensor histidine kinase/response regulator [Bacteroidia bacterium]|nr:hybrid sensor histidine kinase/response regulator [Bacteroidia bacterium]
MYRLEPNRNELTRVLYLEDDPGVARLTQKHLSRAGILVDWTHDGHEGLRMIREHTYDAILVDHNLPEMTGIQVMRAMMGQQHRPPVIMITGSGDEEVAVEAMKLGASEYLIKDTDSQFLESLPTVISHAIRNQELLREREAEYAARERLITELNAFAGNVAHDLKNPLYSLQAVTLVLEDVIDDPEKRARSLTAIRDTVGKMSNIIDELLLLATLRHDQVPVRKVDMQAVVSVALDRLQISVAARKALVSCQQDMPPARGYPSWVEEVWVNYISNALKYGGMPPVIHIGCEAQADGFIRYWVADNGQGLTLEEQSRLFQPFSRLEKVNARGHGLGLSIVRQIMEKLGGRAGVISVPGVGSRFYFDLPPV